MVPLHQWTLGLQAFLLHVLCVFSQEESRKKTPIFAKKKIYFFLKKSFISVDTKYGL